MGSKTGIVVAKRSFTQADVGSLSLPFDEIGGLRGYWWIDLTALAPTGKEVVGGGWNTEDNSSGGSPVATPITIRFQYNGPVIKGYEALTPPPVSIPLPAGVLPAANDAIGWRFQGRLVPNAGATKSTVAPVTVYCYCIYMK